MKDKDPPQFKHYITGSQKSSNTCMHAYPLMAVAGRAFCAWAITVSYLDHPKLKYLLLPSM